MGLNSANKVLKKKWFEVEKRNLEDLRGKGAEKALSDENEWISRKQGF